MYHPRRERVLYPTLDESKSSCLLRLYGRERRCSPPYSRRLLRRAICRSRPATPVDEAAACRGALQAGRRHPRPVQWGAQRRGAVVQEQGRGPKVQDLRPERPDPWTEGRVQGQCCQTAPGARINDGQAKSVDLTHEVDRSLEERAAGKESPGGCANGAPRPAKRRWVPTQSAKRGAMPNHETGRRVGGGREFTRASAWAGERRAEGRTGGQRAGHRPVVTDRLTPVRSP